MVRRRELSDLELDLLRFLAGSGARTSREAAEEFGKPRGYARTTVSTLLERLRGKGYVSRTKSAGVYRYAAKLSSGELMRGVVDRFVNKALGGSVGPLVSFLVENPQLSDEEVEKLRRLVDELGGDE